MEHKKAADCAMCPFQEPDRLCKNADGRSPEGCGTADYPEACREACEEMAADGELMRFAAEASRQEAACYAPSPYDPAMRQPLK